MIGLEVCVDDPAGLDAAVAGGANRIELCAALGLGGLTPSAGLVALAARSQVPVMAMIRPRAGDFIWTEPEIAAQLVEIATIRAAGLAGVVIGASLPDGRLDGATLAQLVVAAKGLDVTLHRAIDLAPDPVAAIGLCHDLGIRRVLSSGGAPSAQEGIARLVAMQNAAPDMTIMPGGGVSAENITALAQAFPLAEVHASCSAPAAEPADHRIASFGFLPNGARVTNAGRVRALRSALDQLTGAATRG